MIYLLPLLFAVLNRARGSGKLNGWLTRIAKVLVPSSIFFFCTDIGSFGLFVTLIITYLVGESLGWGKWVATLCDRQPRYDEEEGHTIFTLSGRTIKFWDGIHHLANYIVKEKDDYLNYSRIALSIRGVYWWYPVLATLVVTNYINWIQAILSLWVLSISFPISFELARVINVKWLENRWEKGEIIYGFFQGLVFLWLSL